MRWRVPASRGGATAAGAAFEVPLGWNEGGSVFRLFARFVDRGLKRWNWRWDQSRAVHEPGWRTQLTPPPSPTIFLWEAFQTGTDMTDVLARVEHAAVSLLVFLGVA